MHISVVGLGYVGLVTSAGLARWGHTVEGVETSPERLHALLSDKIPFHEPDLPELVAAGRESGRLLFSGSNLEPAQRADIVITAVGTHDGNGGWQTNTMRACLSEIVPHMRDEAVLVVRSTLPPEFILELPELVTALRREAGRGPIPVLTNPEFTREGSAVHDFLHPERLIIGIAHDPDGSGLRRAQEAYADVTAPTLVMSAIDAAFAKLGSNLFLATKISFANELALLCDAYGADVSNAVLGMGYDDRIGPKFLKSGIGFGGSCLPHQVTMTVAEARRDGLEVPLLGAVDTVNHRQRTRFVETIESLLGSGLSGRRIALLGLTFKPNTDDLRDAPALTIAKLLIARGAIVQAYDPMPAARLRAQGIVPNLQAMPNVLDAVRGADLVALMTEWAEFGSLDWAAVRDLVAQPIVLDGRGFLDPTTVETAGFAYTGIGRRSRGSVGVTLTPGPAAIAVGSTPSVTFEMDDAVQVIS